MTTKVNISPYINITQAIRFISSLILPLLIMFTRPLNMDWNQSIILAALILVLIWWTTGIVNRTYASIFLLAVFSVFGLTPMKQIFKFPLSSNFYMIALSFLLSQGIVNSNVANRFSNFILNKYANTPYKLIFLSFIFGIVLMFIALHMLLGSAITTLSVVIPILLEMTQGVLNPIVIVLLAYITVNMHYILPFQHVMMMIGAGNGYYSNKVVMRYGIALTFILFVLIFGFYIPWWKLVGLI